MFFVVIAFLRMVHFLRTHDLDFFGGDGDGDEESDTLILQLELKLAVPNL